MTLTVKAFCANCQAIKAFTEDGCEVCKTKFEDRNKHNQVGLFIFLHEPDYRWDDDEIHDIKNVIQYTDWLVWSEWNEKNKPVYWWTRGVFEPFVIVYGINVDELKNNYKLFMDRRSNGARYS